MNVKNWLYVISSVIAAIVFLLLPTAYSESFLLFGMFLVCPVYLSWLTVSLADNTKKAYLYTSASLLVYEVIYLISSGGTGLSAAGIVTVLLPWISFVAGCFVWKLLSLKKHLISLLPTVILFFVSAFPASAKAMLVTLCSVFAYISITVITFFLGKMSAKNPERIAHTKRSVLFIAVMMLISVIISVSNM